jgi:hypothetical protein
MRKNFGLTYKKDLLDKSKDIPKKDRERVYKLVEDKKAKWWIYDNGENYE